MPLTVFRSQLSDIVHQSLLLKFFGYMQIARKSTAFLNSNVVVLKIHDISEIIRLL